MKGYGVRAQTTSKSSAYRSAKQAREEGKQVKIVKEQERGETWYTVWTR